METKDWITISIAAFTFINGWCQFWVKERLFSKDKVDDDPVLKFFKGKGGITVITFTGLVSIVSMWLLAIQVMSSEPLTRISCLVISSLTVTAILNLVLVQALFTIRRLAELKKRIEEAKNEALMYAVVFGS
jgi:hypothetical protein